MRNLSLAPLDPWLDALNELSQGGGDTISVAPAEERSSRCSADIEQEWRARFPDRAPRPGAGADLEAISPSREESARAVSDPDSDSEDDFRVIIEDGPNTRTNRLDRLAARVAEAASPADVDALAGEAGQVRGLAEADHPIARLRDFSMEFTPGFANHTTRFHLLRLDAEWLNEAGRAWEAASDHYRAAATAAAKFGLPPGRVGPLEAAADECEARALHQDLKRDLIQAVLLFKRYRPQFNTGHARILEAILASLRSALERCRSPELAALPLQTRPIEGFDSALRDIGESARRLREAVLQRDSQVTGFARISPGERAARAANIQRQTGELTELAGQLRRALRGEAPPETATPAPPAPAASTSTAAAIEAAPAAADPHAPLRAALVAELDPLLDLADRSEAAARMPNEIRPAITASIEAWTAAAQAYDDAAQAFDRRTKGAADAIFDDPAVRVLRERIADGRRTALAHLLSTLEHRFRELWQNGRSMLEATEKMIESGDDPGRVRSGVLRYAKIAECAEALRAWGAGSNLLRRAPGIDANRLMAPFAALARFLEARVNPVNNPGEALAAAERIRRAIDTAEEASRGANTGLAAALRDFLDYARQARMTKIGTAVAMETTESSVLYRALQVELTALLIQAFKALVTLPDLLSEPPPGGSAPEAAPARHEELIARARAAIARADRRHEETAAFPPDTPAQHARELRIWSAAMKESSACFEASAGILTLCGELKGALETAEPSRRPQVIRRFAERAREIGVNAARTSDEQTLQNLDAAQYNQGQAQANALLGLYTRRNERLAAYTRYVLDTLGSLFEFPTRINRVMANNRGDKESYRAAYDVLARLQRSMTGRVDDSFQQFLGRIQSDRNIQVGADIQPCLEQALDEEEIILNNISVPLKWRVMHEVLGGFRAAMNATLNGLMSRIPAGRHPAINDGLRVLDIMESHLEILGDNARLFLAETANRDRFATEVAANVALVRRVREVQERLLERKAELEAARGGGSGGATSSRARPETSAPASRPPEPGQSADSSRPAQPQSNRGRRRRR